MAWFNFRQNNSGGYFIGAHYVLIEADNAEEANAIAQANGIYFNGCEAGQDCNCCGDRWCTVSDYYATDKPSIYGDEHVVFEKVVSGEAKVIPK